MIPTLNLKINKDQTGHVVGRIYTPSNKENFNNQFYKVRELYNKYHFNLDKKHEAKFVLGKMKEAFPNDVHVESKVFRKFGLYEPYKRNNNEFNKDFREAFHNSLYLYNRRKKEESQAKQRAFILAKMQEKYPEVKNLEEIVEGKFNPQVTAYFKRLKRLSEKLFLNRFNYFVTLTYDDELFRSETLFVQSITMTLAHFANRRGWRYCYCFERGDKNRRLHIHGFFYIPQGEMPGEIVEKTTYSEKHKKLQRLNVSTWFEKHYGINEFSPLDRDILRLGSVIQYCSDYCFKSGDKVHYSRHLPSDIEKEIDKIEVLHSYIQHVERFVLDEETLQFLKEEDALPNFVPCYVDKDYILNTMNRLSDYEREKKK